MQIQLIHPRKTRNLLKNSAKKDAVKKKKNNNNFLVFKKELISNVAELKGSIGIFLVMKENNNKHRKQKY